MTRLDRARDRFPRFDQPLADTDLEPLADDIRGGETIGRPVGSPDLLARLEAATKRVLRPKPRGPKPAAERAKT